MHVIAGAVPGKVQEHRYAPAEAFMMAAGEYAVERDPPRERSQDVERVNDG